MELKLKKGIFEQGVRKLPIGGKLKPLVNEEFTSITWTEADICDHDFVEVMMGRLDIARSEFPGQWVFMTPSVQIVSTKLTPGFVRACHSEEHNWIARVARLLGPFLHSPKTWVLEDLSRFHSGTKRKSIRFFYWTLHCRGNMFAPGSGIFPDMRWREVCGGVPEKELPPTKWKNQRRRAPKWQPMHSLVRFSTPVSGESVPN